MKQLSITLSILLFLLLVQPLAAKTTSSVGVDVKIDKLFIAGDVVKPIERNETSDPIVLRIINTTKVEGGHLYSIQVEGHEPALYDLRNYLITADGKPIQSKEAIEFEVVSILPDAITEPSKDTIVAPKRVGGYTIIIKLLTIGWLILGATIVISWWKRNNAKKLANQSPNPDHSQLNKLVQLAADKGLSIDEQAQLDRLIIGHWKSQYEDLQHMSVSSAIRHLRQQEAPSLLLAALERWMHSPEVVEQSDIDRVIAEYQQALPSHHPKGGSV